MGLDRGEGGVGEKDIGAVLPIAVVGPADQPLALEGAGDGGDLRQGEVEFLDHVFEIDLLAAGVLGVFGEQPNQSVLIGGVLLEQAAQGRAVKQPVQLLRGKGAGAAVPVQF